MPSVLDQPPSDASAARRSASSDRLHADPAPKSPERQLAELHRKLESMPIIEQAKGIVMGRLGVDDDAAITVLVAWSQHTNVKLRTVCQVLVDAAPEPEVLADLLATLPRPTPAEPRTESAAHPPGLPRTTRR